MTRRDRLCSRLAGLLNGYLGEKASWSGGSESGKALDGSRVSWFLTAHRAGNHLSLLETVTTADQSARVVRYWLLAPNGSGGWILEAAEKNHEALADDWINDELEEAVGRLEDPQTARSSLEVPKVRVIAPAVPSPSFGLWPRRFRSFAGLAFFAAAFLILMSYSSMQYHRMIRLVRGINESIGISSTRQTQGMKNMSEKMAAVDNELEQLRDDVQRERMAFEFNRKNTAMTLRRQSEELPWTDYSRKRAFDYLADRIESAGSYREIIYQLSRIPEDNAQAETIMATDRANIISLSSYVSTVPGLDFPVRFDGETADGNDFMISSGYGELRPSSLGTGGYLPHMAVDIINIRNILTVTAENSIVRFPGEPGSAVAAEEGVIIDVGYGSIFGWYVEVSHPLRPEWMEKYNGIDKLSTFYAHLAENPGWNIGDVVQKSEKLGKIGDTGRTTGPHLHYEVRVYRKSGEFESKNGRFDRMNPYIPAE